MTIDYYNQKKSRSVARFQGVTPKRKNSTLTNDDFIKINRYLEYNESADDLNSRLLIHILKHKISISDRISDPAPSNLATSGSTVIYTIDDGSVRQGLLSHWARSGVKRGVISVYTILGATLLGMQTGQRAPLLSESNRVLSLSRLDVSESSISITTAQ